MPKVISLFSGCGGSDAGMVAAGFEVIMANDVLPYARDLYNANLPATDYHLRDISTIKAFPDADVLVGCYPCQGFSVGGVRDPARSINFLYREFDRALRMVKPKAFIVENVAGMRTAKNADLFRNQITRFRLAGYRVKWEVLQAADFGVAQERSRLFFVGIRSDIDAEYFFPSPIEGGDAPTIRSAIAGLPDWPEGEFDTQPFHWYYMSRNRYRGWDEVSKTIVANSRHTPLHPLSPMPVRVGPDHWKFSSDEDARRFSYREIARLQGFGDLVFPDTYSIRYKYRVIGNAVPPPLFENVARSLPHVW